MKRRLTLTRPSSQSSSVSLDAQVLSADAAQASRQHRRSSRDVGSAGDVMSYHSNGSKNGRNNKHVNGIDNDTHGRSSSATPTLSTSSATRQTQMSTSPSLFPDSISLVTLTPVAAAFTAPNSPHYTHSASSHSKKSTATGASGGNRRPSTASVLTADKGAGDSSATLLDSSPQAMRKAQIRRFIASVNRPQSIDLGSDHEAEMAADSGGDNMRANGSRFLLGSVGRARGAAAKQAGLDLHTPLVAFPPSSDEYVKQPASTAPNNKSNNANSAQYATAAMLAMS